MTAPLSNHIPGFAGAMDVEVTGELVVDTGLQEIQSAGAWAQVDNFVPDEEGLVAWYPLDGSSSKIVIRVEKTGINSGTVGDSPLMCSWMALGKR